MIGGLDTLIICGVAPAVPLPTETGSSTINYANPTDHHVSPLRRNPDPEQWLIGCLVLWVFVVPLYLVARNS